jgi:hypothetical protein
MSGHAVLSGAGVVGDGSVTAKIIDGPAPEKRCNHYRKLRKPTVSFLLTGSAPPESVTPAVEVPGEEK